MRSPGRPPVRRDVERAFWVKIAEGLTSEEAAIASEHLASSPQSNLRNSTDCLKRHNHLNRNRKLNPQQSPSPSSTEIRLVLPNVAEVKKINVFRTARREGS